MDVYKTTMKSLRLNLNVVERKLCKLLLRVCKEILESSTNPVTAVTPVRLRFAGGFVRDKV